jgi:hypothetical protein
MQSFRSLVKLNRSFFPSFCLNKNEFHFNQVLHNSREKRKEKLGQKYLDKKSSILVKSKMSISELAKNLSVDSKRIFDCLNKLNYKYMNRDDYVLNNIDVIIKVVKLCGFKHRFEGFFFKILIVLK